MKSILFIAFLFMAFQFSVAQIQRYEDGPFKDYYKSGQVKSEGQIVNGKRDGKWLNYYESGEVSKEYFYVDGKYQENSAKYYYEDGVLKGETIEKAGDQVDVGYYNNGQLKYERKRGGGFYKSYTEDGYLKVEANYYKTDLYGTWKSFYENGNVAWQVNYLNGYRNGDYKAYYENGSLKLEGLMIKDKKKGQENRYSEDGFLEWKGYYDDDVLDKTWIKYNASNEKILKVKFKEGEVVNTKYKDLIVPTTVPEGVIEKVPVYPGCEFVFGNSARKKCMGDELARFVNMNFNTNLALNKGLSGKYRISVIFKIGKDGEIFDVRSRAPLPELQKEAIRVIKLLPKLQPGYQNGEPVEVPYALPILFQL